MRIAYLVNQYPKVSHTFIRREIHALERAGVDVLRLALRGWREHITDDADVKELRHTRHVLRGGGLPLVGALLREAVSAPARFFKTVALALQLSHRAERPWPVHLIYLAEACLVKRWLVEAGVQHLHAHFGTNPAEVALLVEALGGPGFSFTVHGPEEFDKPAAIALGEKLRRARFVVAISSFTRSQLCRWVDAAHWDKIAVVHCGIETAFHLEAPTTPQAGPRLVCVGRLCEQKGQLLLLRAAHRLLKAGVPFELVLAGDGEMRPVIEQEIDRLGLRAAVRITGWISSAQVGDEMLAARALVLPSFAEGLPVVLMEAMALRRPVITTFVAGIPELVIDPNCGWLVPAGDEEALANAMADCLKMPSDELAVRGETARQRALLRHDVDTEATKLARLFAHHVAKG